MSQCALLKQQIPIRTFQEWNEAQPGFLEADLVAHWGTEIEGNYLYTLTLTDVATGWTPDEKRRQLFRRELPSHTLQVHVWVDGAPGS